MCAPPHQLPSRAVIAIASPQLAAEAAQDSRLADCMLASLSTLTSCSPLQRVWVMILASLHSCGASSPVSTTTASRICKLASPPCLLQACMVTLERDRLAAAHNKQLPKLPRSAVSESCLMACHTNASLSLCIAVCKLTCTPATQARMVTLERDRLAAALHKKYSPKLPVDKLLTSLCTDLRMSTGTASALSNSLTVTAKVCTWLQVCLAQLR